MIISFGRQVGPTPEMKGDGSCMSGEKQGEVEDGPEWGLAQPLGKCTGGNISYLCAREAPFTQKISSALPEDSRLFMTTPHSGPGKLASQFHSTV